MSYVKLFSTLILESLCTKINKRRENRIKYNKVNSTNERKKI